jgi:hypothetical protein
MGKKLGYLLIAAVLLIEVPRFIDAYRGIDSTVLTAVGTGVALSGGSMYVFHTWWTTRRKRKDWLLVPFGVNLALAGAILIPWGMAQLRDVAIADVVVGWWAWGWVSVVVLSPFALMGGITTAMAFQKEHRETKQRQTKNEQVEQIVETEEPTVELDETDSAIVQAIEEQPSASYQTIADTVGMPKSTVYGRAKTLEREGILIRDNHR